MPLPGNVNAMAIMRNVSLPFGANNAEFGVYNYDQSLSGNVTGRFAQQQVGF
jgi:hypothetical protein